MLDWYIGFVHFLNEDYFLTFSSFIDKDIVTQSKASNFKNPVVNIFKQTSIMHQIYEENKGNIKEESNIFNIEISEKQFQELFENWDGLVYNLKDNYAIKKIINCYNFLIGGVKMNTNTKYFPNSFDIELAITKGLALNNELNERFIRLENKYRKYFMKYIYETLNLEKYDKEIEDSNLKFCSCEEEFQEYYQKESNLKYIYIKNNLHIERLSDNDLQILETSEDEKELLDLIKNTYEEIIKIKCLNGKKTPEKFLTQMFKGYDTRSTMLPNDALIIIIREGREKNKFNNYEELCYSLKERDKFIENIKEKIQEEITK